MTDVTDTPDISTMQLNAPADGEQATDPAVHARLDELAQIIRAYNDVTDRLYASHEMLNAEVHRLREELASANEALQRSRRLAALGEMAAGIAHEIRNPLASIQLYAGLLKQDLAELPQQHQIAEKIAAAVRGLDGIVSDVLAFARELRLRKVDSPVVQIIRRAVEAAQPMIDQAGVEVVYMTDDVTLACDRELMQQAIVNLIRNAVEAMQTGGTLTLAVEADSWMVRLIVRDTGPGIPDECIDRIFNPFFTTRAAGTGLGLAIVHRIVDAHGGSITVCNDGGAVFTLAIPREIAKESQSPGMAIPGLSRE